MIADEFDHFTIDFRRINQDEYGITIFYWNWYQSSRVIGVLPGLLVVNFCQNKEEYGVFR